MSTYAKGQDGSVKVGTTTLCVNKWEVDLKKDVKEITTTCSGGWKERLAMLKDCSFTVDAYLDLTQVPYGSSLDVFGPDTITVKLYVDKVSASPAFQFTALVTSFKLTSAVGDIQNYTISGDSTGVVTYTDVSAT